MFAVMSMMLCFCITDMPSFQQCCTVYADDDYKPDGLTVGDSGDSVKWIQESLNIINNAGLEENGIFDENTEEAVKVIQGQHNMTQSGVATKATVELIKIMRSKAEKAMTTVTETETETYPTVTESENTENIEKANNPEAEIPSPVAIEVDASSLPISQIDSALLHDCLHHKMTM